MNLLLDTHILLWWDATHPALNSNARAAIQAPGNNVFVSAASAWDIAIKRRLGELVFHGSITAAIGSNGFLELAVLPIDCEQAGDLDWPHSDPFDRLLVAQAVRLGLTLLTADRTVRTFGGVAQIWGGQP